MFNLTSSRGYIIAKNKQEVEQAKKCRLCTDILLEEGNQVFVWKNFLGTWKRERYLLFGEDKDIDFETTGFEAYQKFYYYAGKEEVEKMKHIFEPIPMWESFEQMHYYNFEFVEEKIYKKIYVFDANSAFTYGTLKLPKGFDKLKEYMYTLFEKKRDTQNKLTRARFKNLQNYLVGYFARISDFIRVRSEIIKESNINIQSKMYEINENHGVVYLSNTDSIITDERGADIMSKYVGKDVGQFKLEKVADRLYYKSSNAYQVDDKITYSGVKYFERQHYDFFEGVFAKQQGRLIEEEHFSIYEEGENIYKLCTIKYGEVKVYVFNALGEPLRIFTYKAG